jgi:hypothetical protein
MKRRLRRKSKRGGFMQKSVRQQIGQDFDDLVNHPIAQQVKNRILNHPITQGLVGTLDDGVSTVAGHVENLKEKTVHASLPDPNTAPRQPTTTPLNPNSVPAPSQPTTTPLNPNSVPAPSQPTTTPNPVPAPRKPTTTPNPVPVNGQQMGGDKKRSRKHKKHTRKHKKHTRKHKTHSRKRKTRSRSRKSRSRR